MCGIVGYFGTDDARDVILKGLKKLEYRGYDSAGVALFNPDKDKVEIYKAKGRVDELTKTIDFSFETHFGIGHTRWATHGEPNYINSHPHTSMSGRYIIVHNGVIENFKKLKVERLADFKFKSETDTEVIVNLIEYYSRRMNTPEAIRKTLSMLDGSYALLIIDTQDLEHLYVAKNKTPILIGVGDRGVTVGSDIMALVGYSKQYVSLEDKTFGVITKSGFELYDIIGLPRDYEMRDVSINADDIEKGQYDHYMLKEIDEQPYVVRNLISKYYNEDKITISYELINAIKDCDKINFVACGTSMYASYMAKYFFEKLCSIPSEVFSASELVYSSPLLSQKPFYIFLSQSGETADSICVMKKCRKSHFPVLALTNSEESSMVDLADFHLPIYAGKEIAVASTKAYIGQIVVCSLLAKAVSGAKTNLKNNLNRVALAMEEVLSNKELFKDIAKQIVDSNDCFYIGRGIDYWVSLEAALKLKEVSYIHTEAFSSGELKHGPIALIKKDVPVIAIITQEGTNMITRSNLEETKSRGAKTFIISMESMSLSDDSVIIPNVAHYLTPLVSVIVCQLIAYYAAVLRGNDVDKPKNLAKSVTVE